MQAALAAARKAEKILAEREQQAARDADMAGEDLMRRREAEAGRKPRHAAAPSARTRHPAAARCRRSGTNWNWRPDIDRDYGESRGQRPGRRHGTAAGTAIVRPLRHVRAVRERYATAVRRPGRGRSVAFSPRMGLGPGRDRHRPGHRPADPVPPDRRDIEAEIAVADERRLRGDRENRADAAATILRWLIGAMTTSRSAVRIRANWSAGSATSSAPASRPRWRRPQPGGNGMPPC